MQIKLLRSPGNNRTDRSNARRTKEMNESLELANLFMEDWARTSGLA